MCVCVYPFDLFMACTKKLTNCTKTCSRSFVAKIGQMCQFSVKIENILRLVGYWPVKSEKYETSMLKNQQKLAWFNVFLISLFTRMSKMFMATG